MKKANSSPVETSDLEANFTTSNITHEEENQIADNIEEDFNNAWSEALAERTLMQVATHAFHFLGTLALQSEITLLLLIQWSFSAQSIVALVTVKIFLGRLSPREFSRLTERSVRFAIFKLVFAGVIIPQVMSDSSEIVFWFAWLAFTAYLRVFIGGAKDRLDYLAALPHTSWLSQARPLALTGFLVVLSYATAYYLWTLDSFKFGIFFLCFFDLFCVQMEALRILIRFSIHVYEQRALETSSTGDMDSAPHAPLWEGKGSFLFYLDIVAELILQTSGLIHYFQIWMMRGLRPNIVDLVLFMDVRSILLLISKKIRGLLAYRRITHELNFAFPTKCFSNSHLAGSASNQEGQPQEEEQTCAICMEKMMTAKCLPCSHYFHLSCLRAMLQQSGPHAFVCPLCRTPLLQQQQQQQRATERQQRRRAGGDRDRQDRPTWLSSLVQLAQSVYLDVVIQIFFGFPVDLEALRLRHAMNQERRLQRLIAPGSIGGIATALAGGVVRVEPQGMPRRAGRIRRLRVGDTEEEVGESEAPPRMTGGEDEALDLHQDTLEYLDLDMVAEGEAMLEQGPSAARRSGGRGATRRRSARRTVVGVTRDWEEAGPSSLVVGEEAVEEEWQVAMRPPPYEEEEDDSRSIWSVNVSHQVVRSIRSSMAVGMRGGPAAMAGRLHLSNDQEAESPRIDR